MKHSAPMGCCLRSSREYNTKCMQVLLKSSCHPAVIAIWVWSCFKVPAKTTTNQTPNHSSPYSFAFHLKRVPRLKTTPEWVCFLFEDPQNGGFPFGFPLFPTNRQATSKTTTRPKRAVEPFLAPTPPEPQHGTANVAALTQRASRLEHAQGGSCAQHGMCTNIYIRKLEW